MFCLSSSEDKHKNYDHDQCSDTYIHVINFLYRLKKYARHRYQAGRPFNPDFIR